MTPLEIAAVAVSLSGVILTVRQNIWCWPVGIVGVVLYTILFWQTRLYADMGLQVVYAVLSFYGWYEWLHGSSDRTELPVTHVRRRSLVVAIVAALAFAMSLGFLLERFSDAALPLLDSFLTAFSLVAQWLLTRKHVENWLVWIVVDVVYIGMFAFKDLYLTAGLYALFLVLAVLGYRSWKRTLVTA